MAVDYGFTPVIWDVNDGMYSRTENKVQSESDRAVISKIAARIQSELPEQPTEPVRDIGDINNDGKVDVEDAVMLQEYILGITRLDNEKCYYANCYQDDVLNVFDLIMLKRMII